MRPFPVISRNRDGTAAAEMALVLPLLLAALLSPLWIPVLLIAGLVALAKRDTQQSGVVPA